MKDLKELTIRGGSAKILSQAATFVVRVGSVMVLSRLLEPRDFGLLGMVTAFTGVLDLFRDFGLSTASVQRSTITREQSSTLFWINLAVGAALTLIAILLAPFFGLFYHEPRLVSLTAVVACGFVLNAAGIQHAALLQRQMRFTALATIGTISLVVSTALAVLGAVGGYGYWSLAAMTVSQPFLATMGFWLATRWFPGAPRRGSGIRSMMRFGGTVTLNGLVMYAGFNLEKALLGRFWGAGALGFYTRAYQLIRIPTDNLNSAVGEVAFSALSRIQDDPARFRSYFLKGYSLVVALTLPITIACALFSNDLISVLLGPKWKDAAPIFRLLAPTILVFAIANPLGWLLNSIGMVGRGLKIALVLAPLMIVGYVIGLPHGPQGVALAYSSVMTASAIPILAWATRGTVVSLRDVLVAAGKPLLSGLAAAALALALQAMYFRVLPPLPRLAAGIAVMLAGYLAMLLFAMGQKSFYRDLLRALSVPRRENARRPPVEEASIPVGVNGGRKRAAID
jgi:O-antigen/teichoic acid export membrane protein